MKPYGGTFDRAAAGHLLRRASFAARPGEIDRATADGLDATATRLVDGDPLLELPDSDAATESLARSEEIDGVAALWLARMTSTKAPLRETTALFWHDHFVSAHPKVRSAHRLTRQIELFRRAGLGSFGALAAEIAEDPAMLRYLDAESSTKKAPNENFARELFELFTTGPGAYDERDIKEAARAFTGSGTERERFRFSEAAHDEGMKTVLGATGPWKGADVARLAAAHPRTADFMAAKIARRFLNDDPAPEDVAAVADVWRGGPDDVPGDLSRVFRVLFRSEAFFARSNRLRVTRCPATFVTAALRTAGADSAPTPIALERRVRSMGRALLATPTVKGYAGGEAWLQPATRLARIDFVVRLLSDAADRLRPPALGSVDALRAFATDALGRAISADEAEALSNAAPATDEARERRLLGLVLTRPEFDRC